MQLAEILDQKAGARKAKADGTADGFSASVAALRALNKDDLEAVSEEILAQLSSSGLHDPGTGAAPP